MKSLAFILAASALMAACGQSDKKDANKPESKNTQQNVPFRPDKPAADVSDSTKWTEVKWVNETYDFGKVTEGPKVEVTYRVKNVGQKPLIIVSVERTCGCTETKWPEEPVAPGEEALIKAIFDTQGRVGVTHKTINVVFNGKESPKALTFTGEVTPK